MLENGINGFHGRFRHLLFWRRIQDHQPHLFHLRFKSKELHSTRGYVFKVARYNYAVLS